MAGKAKTAAEKAPGARKATAKPRKAAEGKTKKNQEKTSPAPIDFCGARLTKLRREFIILYCTPGQSCFHNALQAALKAGYKESVARSDIYGILQEPEIQKIVAANERLAHLALREPARRALEIKQARAFFDPAEYFEEKEITIPAKHGDMTKSVMALKPMDKMTREQRMCIDGVDVKGQSSIPVFIMPDRSKELNDILKIDGELSKGAPGGDGEEETMEIIMERLTVKKTVRKAKDEISETANLIRLPKGKAATEL